MTRINTNIASLTAQTSLAASNNLLSNTLTRLSTGLKINSGKDDPAGLIAATALGSNIASTNQAISNSQLANQMISTADSALGQVSTLLTTIRGLVTQAANTGALSSDQIAANQLQIDSSLDAINRISQTTTFQGKNLLDGSLGFITSAGSGYAANVQSLQVNQANLGTAASVNVDMKVTAAATKATITNTIPAATAASTTLDLGNGTGITFSAPTGSTAYNNATVKVVESSTVTNNSPTAVWTAGTTNSDGSTTAGTLTITVRNSGTTTAAAIGQAISGAGFTVSSATGNYVQGTTKPSAQANTSITIGTGSLTLSAKTVDNSFNGTQIVFDTTGTSSTPTVSFSGSPGSAGTLTIQVNSGSTTTVQSIADAINNSTDAGVKQFAASVGGTVGAVFDPTTEGPATVAAAKAAATINVGGPAGAGGMGLVVTAAATGTAGNGLQINIVEGGNAAATTATYDSTYTTGGANGLLTINLRQNHSVSQTDILTAIGSITNVSAAFATSYGVSFTGNSAASITTPNTAAAQSATAASATTSGGTNAASATATAYDALANVGTASHAASFTLTANTPGGGPVTPQTVVVQRDAATTGASYGANTLTITLADGFTGSAADLAAIQTAFAGTGIGSSFTLSSSIGASYTEAATGTTGTAVLNNNASAATTGNIAVNDGTAGAAHTLNLVVAANNKGAQGNGLNIVVNGTGGGSTTTTYTGATNTLTIALKTGFTGAGADLTALQQAFAATSIASQYTISLNTVGGSFAATNGQAAVNGSTQGGNAPSAGTYETGTAYINDGANSIGVTATAKAVGQKTALSISVTEGNAATTTATYNQNNTLTITLAKNATVTTQNIIDALSSTNLAPAVGGTTQAQVDAFLASYNLTVTGVNGATSIHTADTTSLNQPISANGQTAGGHAAITGRNSTLTGAGVTSTFDTGTAGGLTGALSLEIGGNQGNQLLSFISGTTAAQMADAITKVADSTGVSAAVNASTGQLELTSTSYGSAQFVNVNVVNDEGTFAQNLSKTHDNGTDIAATVNNVQATGEGNTVSLNTANLAFSATLNAGVAANTEVQFDIKGGGALFQLGSQVVGSQQARLGIQSASAADLGGSSGRLYQIGSGGNASLSASPSMAAAIVDQAQSQITSLRGRLGAFQKATVDSNISALTNAVTNLTAAQSSIQDTDFAAESANLTKAQILVQSGTSVLGIANKNPENVLSLLRG